MSARPAGSSVDAHLKKWFFRERHQVLASSAA
jgi:hypothetical protein